ncbi:MAG: asparaginase domain-containing protein [Candidatus Burarchaeum sp.]|nr:asparaginase domain-containing protein [Candidatus Burarchaeum sp.]MDO8340015.1 asparaginase domain-containing protein [Candidatus Burarchaeum sp.]
MQILNRTSQIFLSPKDGGSGRMERQEPKIDKMQEQTQKRILWIKTGGTIAGAVGVTKGSSAGVLDEFVSKHAEEEKDRMTVEGRNLTDTTGKAVSVDSSNFDPEIHCIPLAQQIRKAVTEGPVETRFDAIVITHGTNTMEETAPHLAYMLRDLDVPIVVTGSQTPAEEPGSDAFKNIQDSMLAAQVLWPGVYVVFGGDVILGTRAHKKDPYAPSGFISKNYPLVGEINADGSIGLTGIRPYRAEGTPNRCIEAVCTDIHVMDAHQAMNLGPNMLEAIPKDYKGVVIRGFGKGELPGEAGRQNLHEIVRRWAEMGIPTLITSRCEQGLVQCVKGASPPDAIYSGDMAEGAAIAKFRHALAMTEGMSGKNRVKEVKRIMTKENWAGEIRTQQLVNYNVMRIFDIIVNGQQIHHDHWSSLDYDAIIFKNLELYEYFFLDKPRGGFGLINLLRLVKSLDFFGKEASDVLVRKIEDPKITRNEKKAALRLLSEMTADPNGVIHAFAKTLRSEKQRNKKMILTALHDTFYEAESEYGSPSESEIIKSERLHQICSGISSTTICELIDSLLELKKKHEKNDSATLILLELLCCGHFEQYSLLNIHEKFRNIIINGKKEEMFYSSPALFRKRLLKEIFYSLKSCENGQKYQQDFLNSFIRHIKKHEKDPWAIVRKCRMLVDLHEEIDMPSASLTENEQKVVVLLTYFENKFEGENKKALKTELKRMRKIIRWKHSERLQLETLDESDARALDMMADELSLKQKLK